jgi:flavodoxin
VSCIYGTVTGKAQSIAEQIVETGGSKGIKVNEYGSTNIYFFGIIYAT